MPIALNRKRFIMFSILALIGISIVFAVLAGIIPSKSLFKKQASVELKTTYKNPFDKESQYVNPFQEYKNPFVVNR